MRSVVLRRALQLPPVLLLVSIIVFLILHLLPGDPVQLMLAGAEGGLTTPERMAELRHTLGIDDPLALQYLRFLGHALRGDLGISIRYEQSVLDLILDRLPSTLSLALFALALAVLIGGATGILAALRPHGIVDSISTGLATIGVSMPVYWLGLLLILGFSFRLHWFPSAGGAGLAGLVMPGLTLALAAAGTLSRLVRASLLDTMGADFIRTARAKGLRDITTVWRHALRHALVPVVTMLGLQFGAMLAGAVVTETVFSRPGLGRLILEAILNKDFPLVQGCVLFVATLYLLVNFAVDLLYLWLDPRIAHA